MFACLAKSCSFRLELNQESTQRVASTYQDIFLRTRSKHIVFERIERGFYWESLNIMLTILSLKE